MVAHGAQTAPFDRVCDECMRLYSPTFCAVLLRGRISLWKATALVAVRSPAPITAILAGFFLMLLVFTVLLVLLVLLFFFLFLALALAL